jgi:hypothetical protein
MTWKGSGNESSRGTKIPPEVICVGSNSILKRGLFLVPLALLLGSVVVACKPQAGGSCKPEGKEACVDEKSALACHDGKWTPLTCRGQDGCFKGGGEEQCDQSTAQNGDACNLPDDYVCTADRKAMLQCSKNKWTLVQNCLGDRGCVKDKQKVTCDNSVANVGDACREEEDYACAADGKTALACRKGQFVLASPCKGPKHCRVTSAKDAGFKVECDDSIAEDGDPCETEEHFSCSADSRAILRCRGKKFKVEEKCRSKESCQIRGGQVGCYVAP